MGLINDKEYANNFIEYYTIKKFHGLKKIIFKLKPKGLDVNLIKSIYEKIINSNGGEEIIINKYIEKNMKDIESLIKNKEINKIKLKLLNNGFSMPAINNVIRELKTAW